MNSTPVPNTLTLDQNTELEKLQDIYCQNKSEDNLLYLLSYKTFTTLCVKEDFKTCFIKKMKENPTIALVIVIVSLFLLLQVLNLFKIIYTLLKGIINVFK